MELTKKTVAAVFIVMAFSALVYCTEGCSVCTVRNGTDVWPRRSSKDPEGLNGYDLIPKLTIAGGIAVALIAVAMLKRRHG